MLHGVAAILQVTPDNIEDNRRHSMADMGLVIGRHATDIHAYKARLNRLKRLNPARERVIEFNCHNVCWGEAFAKIYRIRTDYCERMLRPY